MITHECPLFPHLVLLGNLLQPFSVAERKQVFLDRFVAFLVESISVSGIFLV
jgi:hypothetical protein